MLLSLVQFSFLLYHPHTAADETLGVKHLLVHLFRLHREGRLNLKCSFQSLVVLLTLNRGFVLQSLRGTRSTCLPSLLLVCCNPDVPPPHNVLGLIDCGIKCVKMRVGSSVLAPRDELHHVCSVAPAAPPPGLCLFYL